MMQKNSEKKAGTVISSAIIAIILLLFAGVFTWLFLAISNLIIRVFLLLYIGVLLAVAAGILISLRQRLNEIKKGEAEEAKKY